MKLPGNWSLFLSKNTKEAHVDISIANFVEGDVLVTGAVQRPGSCHFAGIPF